MSGYSYPSTADAFWLILENGDGLLGPVTPYFHMTPDFADDLPAAQVILLTGVEGFLERVDRVQVDFYAEGATAAAAAAEDFKQRVAGENLTVADVGLFDRIEVELVPHDVPYPSDRVNVCSATYRATTRPKI